MKVQYLLTFPQIYAVDLLIYTNLWDKYIDDYAKGYEIVEGMIAEDEGIKVLPLSPHFRTLNGLRLQLALQG